MKKLKDFIYDKNDIIIAALILAAAALIIAWRMDVILQYPKELINANDPVVEDPIDGDTQPDDSNIGDKPADNTGADNNGSSDNSGTAGDDNTNPAQSAQLWVDGKLSKDVEVDVTGVTASSAVQCLIDAGLFSDYAEYQSACDSQGLDHEKVSAGTFTFAKGSTKAQVARKINWS